MVRTTSATGASSKLKETGAPSIGWLGFAAATTRSFPRMMRGSATGSASVAWPLLVVSGDFTVGNAAGAAGATESVTRLVPGTAAADCCACMGANWQPASATAVSAYR